MLIANAAANIAPLPTPAAAPHAVAPVEPVDSVCLQKPVMVALGDSLTAGTQDGVQSADRQMACYFALIAGAAGIGVNLPLINGSVPPGFWTGTVFDVRHVVALRQDMVKKVGPIAAMLEYVGTPDDLSPVWKIDGMGKRDPATRDTAERPQHNFAVAGYELRHLNDVRSMWDYVRELRESLDEKGGLVMELPGTREILQNGEDAGRGSQVDQAIRLQPDLVLFWGGANDALVPAFDGVIDDRTLTPIVDQVWDFWHKDLLTNKWSRRQSDHPMKGFYSALSGQQGAITRLLRETKAEIMLMNLPNIAAVPFLRELGRPMGPLPFRVILQDGTDVTEQLERYVIPDAVNGEGKEGRTQFPPGTKVGLTNLLGKLAASNIQNVAQMHEEMRRLEAEGAFDEWEVLDSDEIERVDDRIDEFNQVIARAARNPRVHLVDMHAVMNDMRDNGRDLRGAGPPVRVTTRMTGAAGSDGVDGIFSYDGVHPSNTGHAVVANIVLDKIKQDLGSRDKFRVFKDAPPIDEKVVYNSDPHRGERPALILIPDVAPLLAPDPQGMFTSIRKPPDVQAAPLAFDPVSALDGGGLFAQGGAQCP